LIYQGGCHCGAVRFEVEAPDVVEADRFNCSICRKSGYLHLIVPRSRFRLLAVETGSGTPTSWRSFYC
jgi:hypothetical protein